MNVLHVFDAGMPARLRECHQRVATSGAVVGDLGYYRRICSEPPESRRDKEPWIVSGSRR